MAMLNREDWYDLARTTNWTPRYVTEDQLFPEQMSGSRGIPMAAWEGYDEPYKTSYPEYVSIQREKLPRRISSLLPAMASFDAIT